MKSHNPEDSGPVECTSPEWDLLPWLVNGSLPEDEAQEVRKHTDACAACTAEIMALQRLEKALPEVQVEEAAQIRSWDSLRARIDAEARATQAAKPRWSFKGLPAAWIAGVGSAALACLVIAVQVGGPMRGDFVTLTSEAAEAETMMRFQVQSGLEEAQIQAVLATHGAELISGPSDAGVYVAKMPEGTNMKDAAKALMDSPEVTFAAPEILQ